MVRRRGAAVWGGAGAQQCGAAQGARRGAAQGCSVGLRRGGGGTACTLGGRGAVGWWVGARARGTGVR